MMATVRTAAMFFARTFALVITYPATLAHELTHAIAAKPWAERLEIDLNPFDGDYGVTVHWREDAPGKQVVMASIMPFVAGMVALAGALVMWVLDGFTLPTSGVGLAKLSIVAMWWVLYVVPSPADVNTAINGGNSQ